MKYDGSLAYWIDQKQLQRLQDAGLVSRHTFLDLRHIAIASRSASLMRSVPISR